MRLGGGVAPRSSISSRDPPPLYSREHEGRFFFEVFDSVEIESSAPLPFLFRWNSKNQSLSVVFLFGRWMCVVILFFFFNFRFRRRFRRLIKKERENLARRFDEFFQRRVVVPCDFFEKTVSF